jgi:hypothetical protein
LVEDQKANEYLIKLPQISIEAKSEAEAYGLVMMWLNTTLSYLPICNGLIIEPVEVKDLKRKSIPKISKKNCLG